MKEVVVVSGVRLPVGSYGGSLKDITAIDMGAMVVKEAVKRAGIQPSDVDEVVIGQVGEVAENGFIARAVSLKAGMPKETTAYSVNRQCGSGLQSIAEAVMEIQTGQADVVVAGGTENISRLPYYVNDARWGARMGHKVFEDGVIDILTWPLDGNHNGVTAENVAEKYHVTREEVRCPEQTSHLHTKACERSCQWQTLCIYLLFKQLLNQRILHFLILSTFCKRSLKDRIQKTCDTSSQQPQSNEQKWVRCHSH